MCHIILVTLSLALIVLIGGLFLLGYAKKENLGWFTKGAAYLSVAFGTGVFVIGLVGILMCGMCHKSKCSDKNMKCGTEMSHSCSGSYCGDKSMSGHHGMRNHHMDKKDCCAGMDKECKAKMGRDEKCEKGDACCKKEMKEVKVEKKVVVKEDK